MSTAPGIINIRKCRLVMRSFASVCVCPVRVLTFVSLYIYKLYFGRHVYAFRISSIRQSINYRSLGKGQGHRTRKVKQAELNSRNSQVQVCLRLKGNFVVKLNLTVIILPACNVCSVPNSTASFVTRPEVDSAPCTGRPEMDGGE